MTRAEYEKYLRSPRWKMLRFAVRWVQQDRCALCGCVTPNLVVHHNDYARVGKERFGDLVGLCKRCNGRHHALWKRKAAQRADKQGTLELEGTET